ncbi:MAG: DMP19 family protein [Chitinophagales bacterium]
MNIDNTPSPKPANKNTDPYWEFEPYNHFRPKINQEDYTKLTEFNFGWLILKPITEYIHFTKHEIDKGKHLSYAQKALYYWWYLDGQVLNGGFGQFYFNGYGKYVPTIIKGLKYIGDDIMVSIIEDAEKFYQKHKKFVESTPGKIMFADEEDVHLDKLRDLTIEYFGFYRKTMQKIETYFRAHPNEVCLNENGNEIQTN